jgi:tRNA1Val (adenine37-N6)-methyltransferase
MANPYFKFKQFTVYHDRCAMKVTTDSCFFGAWIANEIHNAEYRIKEVLDIGTGTGLLSLMIAQKNELNIDAVEIDKEASQQATENIQASPWENRIQIFNEDILSFEPNKKYDCIISNPPFYENELVSEQPKKNIAHHSKQLTIAEVLRLIKFHLQPGGTFFLMLPFKRKEEIDNLLRKHDLRVMHSVILSQSVNHSPFRTIIKGTTKKTIPGISTSIAICNEHQQYTSEFIHLLKNYYLYL